MRIGVLMRPSRFEDLQNHGLFRPGTQDRSSLHHLRNEILEVLLIDFCKPCCRGNGYDIILHKVFPPVIFCLEPASLQTFVSRGCDLKVEALISVQISDFLSDDEMYQSAETYLIAFEMQHAPGSVIDPLPHALKVWQCRCRKYILHCFWH